MKHILNLFLFLFILSSCSKNEELKIPDNTKKENIETELNKENSITQQGSKQIEGISDGIKNLVYETTNIPKVVKYSGKIVAAAKWEDKNGYNILIVCESDEITKDDERSKELFAYQYLIEGENAKLLWKVNDFIKDCPFDVTLSYFPKSLTVTDLNNNSIAENSFIYKMACKSDISPNDMKLIMHEGENKFAIRGQMILQLDNESFGGDIKIDPSFNNAPSEFLDFAKKQWDKFNKEKISYK